MKTGENTSVFISLYKFNIKNAISPNTSITNSQFLFSHSTVSSLIYPRPKSLRLSEAFICKKLETIIFTRDIFPTLIPCHNMNYMLCSLFVRNEKYYMNHYNQPSWNEDLLPLQPIDCVTCGIFQSVFNNCKHSERHSFTAVGVKIVGWNFMKYCLAND